MAVMEHLQCTTKSRCCMTVSHIELWQHNIIKFLTPSVHFSKAGKQISDSPKTALKRLICPDRSGRFKIQTTSGSLPIASPRPSPPTPASPESINTFLREDLGQSIPVQQRRSAAAPCRSIAPGAPEQQQQRRQAPAAAAKNSNAGRPHQ